MRKLCLLVLGVILYPELNAQSAPIWSQASGSTSNFEERAHDIAVDSLNNLTYLVGSFQDASVFPGIVATQMNAGTNNGLTDGFLAQMNPNGTVNWAVSVSGPDNDEITGVDVDAQGNVYLTGYFRDFANVGSVSLPDTVVNASGADMEVVVVSYDNSGNVRWVQTGGGANDDMGNDIAVAYLTGDVYVTGTYENSAVFNGTATGPTFVNTINGFLTHYNSAGTFQWLAEMKSNMDDRNGATSIEEISYRIGANDTAAFVIGYFEGAVIHFYDSQGNLDTNLVRNNSGPTNADVFIGGIHQNGNWLWTQTIGQGSSDNLRGFGLALDCNGLYLSGSVHSGAIFSGTDTLQSAAHDNPYLVALDLTSGAVLWLNYWESNSNHDDVIHGVVADGFGELYVVGIYSTANFLQPDTSLTPVGGSDLFIANFTAANGTFGWAETGEGVGDNFGYSLAMDGRDQLFITGEYENQLRFGPLVVNGPANPNYFVSQLQVFPGQGTVGCCSSPPMGGSVLPASANLCPGDSTNLQLSGSNGAIQWQSSTDGGLNWANLPGDTLGSVSVRPDSAQTLYRAVLSSFGCLSEFSDTSVVQILSSPQPNLGADTLLCTGNALTLSPGPGFNTYAWQNGNTSSVDTARISGMYSVRVTNAFGCEGSDSVYVDLQAPQIPLLGADTLLCDQASLNLSVNAFPGATYLWSTADTVPAITATNSGLYWIALDTAGCLQSDSINLGFESTPLVNLGADTTICDNDSLQLNAGTGGANYLWSNGDTTATIWVSLSGQYTVIASSPGGCSVRDSLKVTAVSAPVVSLTGLAPLYCENDSPAVLTLTPANGILSGPGISGSSFDPALTGPGGPYTLSYTFVDTLSGCVDSTTAVTEVGATPPAAMAGSDELVYGSSIPALGANNASGFALSWQVLEGNGTFGNANDPNSSFSDPDFGSNTLIWEIDGGSCGITRDTVLIEFVGLIIPTGFSPNGDGKNDFFVVQGIEQYPGAKLFVFNRWGTEVFRAERYQNDWDGSNFSKEPLTDDTYYAVIKFDAEIEHAGFLVIKR